MRNIGALKKNIYIYTKIKHDLVYVIILIYTNNNTEII